MPEMPDVVATEPVESSWGNLIRSRTGQRYQDEADRTALNPVPETGDLAVMLDSGTLELFDGAVWKPTGVGALIGFDGFHNATILVPTNTTTSPPISNARFTSGDTTLPGGVFTVPAGGAGFYTFGFGCEFAEAVDWMRLGCVHSSGARYETHMTFDTPANSGQQTWAARFLNAGETITPAIRQETGGDRTLTANNTRFWVARIS